MTNHQPNCEDATGAYPGSCTCKVIAVSERKALVERLRPTHLIVDQWLHSMNKAADQIEADGQRIAELEAALRKCAEPSRYHAPCPSCGPRMTEQGCYIARAALGDKHD